MSLGESTDRARWRRIEGRFLKPYRRPIAAALLVTLVQSLLLLPIPLLQGWVIDRLSAAAGDESLRSAATEAIGIALGCTLGILALRGALSWRASCEMSRISLEVVRDLTNEMHRKLQRLPLAFYDHAQTGHLMSRLTSDVGSLLLFLKGSTLGLVCDLILAAGIAVVLVAIHPMLAALSFAVLPLYLANYWLFQKTLRRRSAQSCVESAELCALVCERLTAIRVVRSFAQEEAEMNEFRRRLDRHRALSWKALRSGRRQSVIAILVGGCGALLAMACGAAFVNTHELSVGELLAFYTLLGQLYVPLLQVTQFSGVLNGTRVAVDRMAEVLEQTEDRIDRPSDIRPVCGAIALHHVSFRYGSGRPFAVEEVDLVIEPGKKIVILGASGSGKSTLLALIPRLYDVCGGRIEIAGVDIRDLPQSQLRRTAMLVPQQAQLFDGTLRSNLIYGRPDALDEDLYRALDTVALTDFVDGLPLGLDTPVGDRGTTLSGGQRQRLALARALVADPPILLLDDCTSALDAATEAFVLQRLRRGRKTCVQVSHRIATAMQGDWVALLDRGRIIEQGEPNGLCRAGGAFAQLVERHQRQMRGSLAAHREACLAPGELP